MNKSLIIPLLFFVTNVFSATETTFDQQSIDHNDPFAQKFHARSLAAIACNALAHVLTPETFEEIPDDLQHGVATAWMNMIKTKMQCISTVTMPHVTKLAYSDDGTTVNGCTIPQKLVPPATKSPITKSCVVKQQGFSLDDKILSLQNIDKSDAPLAIQPPSCIAGKLTCTQNPRGETIIAGSTEGSVCLWDLRGKKWLACWQAGPGEVVDVALSSHDMTAASLTHHQGAYTLKLWDLTGMLKPVNTFGGFKEKLKLYNTL